ncbi:MAG: TIM barrel protein [Thermoguttaceae bacterium]|nr:TIM barrel protein [Thermoguttaceae bacterium]
MPEGQEPSRRYADVCHINPDEILVPQKGRAYAEKILAYAKEKGVELSALLYCANPIVESTEREHLQKVIRAAAVLNIPTVVCFVGRKPTNNIDDNFDRFKTEFKPIIQTAEECGVNIGAENCPMLFDSKQWPGGLNLTSSPANWERAFEIFPSANFNLTYDASHFCWLGIDPVAPLLEFKDRVVHIHAKDLAVRREKLERVGILGYPLDYMEPVLVGRGDVPWNRYFDAIYRIGFQGSVCLEFEDKRFEPKKSEDDEITRRAILKAKRFLDQFVV